MHWEIEELVKVSEIKPEIVKKALNTIWAENPQLKRMVVINAYLDGKINLSKAAEELGLNRLELEEQLKTEGIPVRRLSEDDIRAEAEAVKRW
jgi:predicted HTH domain antitoxin